MRVRRCVAPAGGLLVSFVFQRASARPRTPASSQAAAAGLTHDLDGLQQFVLPGSPGVPPPRAPGPDAFGVTGTRGPVATALGLSDFPSSVPRSWRSLSDAEN